MSPRRSAGRVVGLGLCVVDHLYVVERLDPSAERIYYVERRVTGGGMIGNALTQAARLGCQTHALSALGDDADGRFVRRCLRAAGVITRRLVVDAGCPTSIAVVQIDRRTGERRFLVADRRARCARSSAARPSSRWARAAASTWREIACGAFARRACACGTPPVRATRSTGPSPRPAPGASSCARPSSGARVPAPSAARRWAPRAVS